MYRYDASSLVALCGVCARVVLALIACNMFSIDEIIKVAIVNHGSLAQCFEGADSNMHVHL